MVAILEATLKVRLRLFARELWCFKSCLLLILTPLVCLPLIFSVGSQEAKCAYVVIIMAVYWMAEVLPLPVTALMPLFMFPALGVLKSKDVAMNYMKDVNVLFIGGLIIAIAVEESNLHKRIALRVLMIVGSTPRWLLLGFMGTTWFLSMWISNTATTAMMVPIVEAVLIGIIRKLQLIKHKRAEEAAKRLQTDPEAQTQLVQSGEGEDTGKFLTLEKLSPSEIKLCRCLLLAVAYAANIGGTGTLTGTPPNIVMAGLIESTYGPDTGISFATWMAFSLPGAIINLFIAWAWIQLFFLGWRSLFFLDKEEKDKKVEGIIRRRYEKLGSVTWAEVSVLILFVFLVLLWLLRDPKFISGWSALFRKNFMSDGSAAIFITFFLFWLPSEKPDFLCFGCRDPSKPPNLRQPLLSWEKMEKKFPWGIAILLGGGFALGNAVQKSGLSKLLGAQLESLAPLGATGLCAVAIIIMTFTTEVTSNTATANIFIPILCAVAEALQVNPLYFVLGITVCASFAFMLPVATPPNAIVFSSGLLHVMDMAIVGFGMNIFGILVMLLSINTWTYKMFNLGEYPDWAAQSTILNLAAENSSSLLLGDIWNSSLATNYTLA